mmetsp:Transcript_41577/g.63445  ORF Transcript_41577/g.63445 Transcript_41577/m.63445 type:complete len:95 (+) Transcript_41577:1085-1369(+)
MTDDTQRIGGNYPIKSVKTYNFKYEKKPYSISSFSSIGWPDPFPRPIPQGKGIPNISVDELRNQKNQAKLANKKTLKSEVIFEETHIDPVKVIL